MSEKQINKENICQVLTKIYEQKNDCVEKLDRLEGTFMTSGDKENVTKVEEELEKMVDQVDTETHTARKQLLEFAKRASYSNTT